MFTIGEIAQRCGGQLIQGTENTTIHWIHFDSRQMKPDGLFVALTDGQRDGHFFLQSARENGAAAALISDASYAGREETAGLALVLVPNTLAAFQDLAKAWREQLGIPVIAVTGSNGKTTTKDMIAHLLDSKYTVFKTYKNYNNHIGVPLSLLQIDHKHQAAVLEMGMNHYGEIDLVASLAKPDIGIITNVNDAHMQFFGSRDNIARAKGELLDHVSPDGYVLLNADDPYVTALRSRFPGKVIFYGVNGEGRESTRIANPDMVADKVEVTETGSKFRVFSPSRDLSFWIEMPLCGTHNVSNLLPGIWIALEWGCSPQEIADAAKTLSISPMRFEIIRGMNGAVLINDAYNASPASMKQAALTFSGMFSDRDKLLVLGDMFELGEQSESLHREVGAYLNILFPAAGTRPMLVTIGNLSAVISDEYAGEKRHFTEKEEAAAWLKEQISSSSCALLFKASRGMKLEDVVEKLKEDKRTEDKL